MSALPMDRGMFHGLRSSKIRGVWPAIVVDNKDGEGNPGYRVKLKFPWLNEQDTSFWARIAVPMGGSGRGTYVLPEIDDQVLVVFEHGDIDRPIIIGGLWSKKQEPVEVNQSGKNNTKLIKSRAGHRIIFDDKEGAEKIAIVDATKKNKIVLDSINKLVKIESDGDIEVIAKTNVVMHANALKIGTTDGVTGKGASLLVHSAKTLGLKAASGITIGGGNATVNVSNAAATRVSGSGAGELGGAAAEAPKDQVEVTNRGGGSGGGGASKRVAGGGAGPTPAMASAAQAQPPPAQDPQEPEKGDVWVRLDIHPEDASRYGDRLILSSTDGSFSQTLVLRSDQEPNEETIDVRFTEVPVDKQYSLQVIPPTGPAHHLFQGVSYGELGGLGGEDDDDDPPDFETPDPDEVSES